MPKGVYERTTEILAMITDEKLAAMEESWLTIDEVDRPRSLEQAIADIDALIHEVRRLRGWQDGYRHENARIADDAIRRAERAEAERNHLRVELESLKQNITSQYRNTGLR